MSVPLLWLFPSLSWAAGEASMPSGMSTSGAAGAGGPTQWWMHWQLVAAAVVLVAAVVLWLIGKATQSRYLKPGWISGVALLILAYLITSFVVVAYKKPGQMSVIEAQAMDMSLMKPPLGTVPVATEKVKPTTFAPAITYTGTVVAYNDEDVYPRVPGTIVSLPVYPGDQVRAGQLLVRLDDVELSAREREAQWDREAAVRARATSRQEEQVAWAARQQAEAGLGQAGEEVKVAQREVRGAEAERTQSERAVQQAQHNVEAARQEVEAARAAHEQAQANAAGASAGVEAAQADVESAKADLAYWQEEIKRAKQLLDVGAYSTDEYQKELSQYGAAKAKVSQTQAAVTEKKQALASAQAAIKQATAATTGAQARMAAAQSEVDKAQAGVDKAEAAIAIAEARVASTQAAVRAARAGRDEKTATVAATVAKTAEASAAIPQRAAALTAARTVRGYTEVRATKPGSVIQRLVSPGVLVQPGTPILRIAQLDRVRLQAYVSQADTGLVAIGARVEARSPKLPGGVLDCRVTSISPAADPTTRTSIVEAVIQNPRRVLSAGDSVTLRLFATERYGVLTVPNSAIVTRTVPAGGPQSKQEATVWLALAQTTAPGQVTAGKKAHQVAVRLGAIDGQRTEVTAGLKAGDEVIVRGAESLREGDLVYPVAWTEAGPVELPPGPMGAQSKMPAPSTAPPTTGGHKR